MMINTDPPPQRTIIQPNLMLEYEFLNYLVQNSTHAGDRVPALGELSTELCISVSKLREQLEVARSLGIVTVRPRTGIHRQEYDFLHAVRLSLFFALASDISHFDAYSELRKHIERAFWHEAVVNLTDEDKQRLRELVGLAWDKLRGNPVRIPHAEHRQFHLTIFSRIDNAFVRGILEAYWDAYEAVQLNTYADYAYLNQVWTYHERIAEAIIAGQVDESLQAFIEHTRLLPHLAQDVEESNLS